MLNVTLDSCLWHIRGSASPSTYVPALSEAFLNSAKRFLWEQPNARLSSSEENKVSWPKMQILFMSAGVLYALA